MVVLVVYVPFVLGCWWPWLRSAPAHGASRAAHASRLSSKGAPPSPPRGGRAARCRRVRAPSLTEDDVIEFGLTLEGTEDVVRRALEDSRRPPVQPRVRRDVSGPP